MLYGPKPGQTDSDGCMIRDQLVKKLPASVDPMLTVTLVCRVRGLWIDGRCAISQGI